jgi:UDPglucose--hexose-1-phosphate uridylyltransferase
MPIPDILNDKPHRRHNALLDEWVLVSPHRTKRPWQGKVEKTPPDDSPAYKPECYLCPGNTRAGGAVTEKYETTYVFTNDFAALLTGDEAPEKYESGNGLIQAREERGICRVICFSPKHNLTLPRMDVCDIRNVIDVWGEQYLDLAATDGIGHVMIFENKGGTMGCSNPHPHGQIWATESFPSIAGKKIGAQERYFATNGKCLLMDYLAWELEEEERIIQQNDSFVAVVPFWAVWPYEMMILPRRPVATISELSDEERNDWATLLKDALTRYDNVFETSFPYSMGLNQRPTDGGAHDGVILHQSFFPPLLRSATVKKFQVGYEMSGEPQRDITAEQAAQKLRDCAPPHYLG